MNERTNEGKNEEMFTSDAVSVVVVDLLDVTISKGQLPHPIHSPTHTCGHAEAGVGCSRVEAVRQEVIRTVIVIVRL